MSEHYGDERDAAYEEHQAMLRKSTSRMTSQPSADALVSENEKQHQIWRLADRIEESMKAIRQSSDLSHAREIALSVTWLTAETRGCVRALLTEHQRLVEQVRRQERIIELERHALNRRPLCPDCRDKTKADEECLRCRYQRAEARAASLSEQVEKLKAEKERFWYDADTLEHQPALIVAHLAVARLERQGQQMREALEPFAQFAEAFDAKPLLNLDDEFYGIHTGTEWQASLRVSDCRKAKAALASSSQTEQG